MDNLAHLSPEKEADLVRDAQAGDREATNDLLRAYRNRFERHVRRWGVRPEDAEWGDLLQAARRALVRCVDSYDPDRGTPFRNYAGAACRRAVGKAYYEHRDSGESEQDAETVSWGAVSVAGDDGEGFTYEETVADPASLGNGPPGALAGSYAPQVHPGAPAGDSDPASQAIPLLRGFVDGTYVVRDGQDYGDFVTDFLEEADKMAVNGLLSERQVRVLLAVLGLDGCGPRLFEDIARDLSEYAGSEVRPWSIGRTFKRTVERIQSHIAGDDVRPVRRDRPLVGVLPPVDSFYDPFRGEEPEQPAGYFDPFQGA